MYIDGRSRQVCAIPPWRKRYSKRCIDKVQQQEIGMMGAVMGFSQAGYLDVDSVRRSNGRGFEEKGFNDLGLVWDLERGCFCY